MKKTGKTSVSGGEPPKAAASATAAATAAAGDEGSNSSTQLLLDKFRQLLSKQGLADLGTLAKRGAVEALRLGLVPIADSYAHSAAPAEQKTGAGAVGDLPSNHLTADEIQSLQRAGAKFLLEAGDLLVAAFPPVPGVEGKLPDRKLDANGSRGELSLVMALAAIKGVQTVYRDHVAKQAEAARLAEIKAQAESLRPVSVNVLRLRNRG